MNVWKKAGTKRLVALLLTVFLAVGCLPWAGAEEDAGSGGLQPPPNYYDNNGEPINSSEDAALTLSKTAVRTAADTWRVTVSATIDDTPIERQKMEVVFVLDASGSMEFCTDLAEHSKSQTNHDHNDTCRIICGRTIHVHNDNCYASTISCGLDSHTHSNSCYGSNYTCGLTDHEHKVSSSCYIECNSSDNPSHYYNSNGYSRHKEDGTSCTAIKNGSFTKYYILNCSLQEHEHSDSCRLSCTRIAHTHTGACKDLVCTKDEHEHTSSCYSCGKVDGNHSPGGGNLCSYRVYENGRWQTKYYKSRMEVAKNTINGMINNLQTEMGNNVSFRYVIFSSHYYTNKGKTTYYRNGVNKDGNTKEVSSFADVTAEGGTQLYHGIEHGLDLFSNNSNTKKILVVLNDGAADDSMSNVQGLSKKLTDFKETNTIFTVGFAHDGENLAQLAGGPGGQYLYASNEADLIHAMADIQQAITAMLVDPMGPAVGFETGSIHINSNQNYVDGDVAYENNTLYWNPSNDNNSIANKTIEYSYTVTLNEEGKAQPGLFDGVDLNKPTELIYGIRDPETGVVSNTKKSNFPIPQASYSIAGLQVKCQYQGNDIADVLTETVVSDYGTPAFTLDCENPEVRYIHKSGNDYYEFNENAQIIYTINGSRTDDEGNPYTAEDMVPSGSNECVVIFPYKLTTDTQIRTVSYKFVGDVLPPNADMMLPSPVSAKKDGTVKVADQPTHDDYVFDGWREEIGDITITDGRFIMPDRDVVLVGSWKAKENHTVTYRYEGNEPQGAPEVPPAQTYRTADEVVVAGVPTLEGYTFTGWRVQSGLTESIDDGSFTMPNNNVVLVGNWTRNEYKVTYQFEGDVPENVPELPEENYYAGTEVNVAAIPNLVEGYTFTGWNAQDGIVDADIVDGKFAMPTNNVVLVGTWAKQPAYIVQADYYLVEGGVATKVNTDSVVLAKETCTENQQSVSYAIKDEDHQYGEGEQQQLYPTVEVPLGSSYTINEAGTEVSGIVPAADPYTEVLLNFYRYRYDVTITGDEGVAEVTNGLTGGTAAVQTATEGEAAVSLEKTYDAGSDVTVTYALKAGYQLDSVTVQGDEDAQIIYSYTEDENTVTISNLQANATVEVKTKKQHNLYVKYVFSDGTNHDADGYPSVFKEQSRTYYTGDSWSVTPGKQVLNQYTFVATKSGEVSGADAVDVNGYLSGTFGAGDVYAVVYYQLLPSYRVEIHYFTNKNGNGYQEDGSKEVVKLTYTANETVEVNFASHLTYKEKVYASPQMVKNEYAQLDADANKVSVQPQLTTNHVVVNVYRVENDAATYQVDHKYTVIGPDGNPVGEPVTVTGEIITGAHGDSIDSFTPDSEYDGYSYDQTNSPAGIVLDAEEHKTVTLEYVRYLYSVTYQWEGTEQPDGVKLPEEAIYSPDASVDVAKKPSAEGWSFDGWHVQSGLTESIDDGSFTMPNNNVVLVGSWAKIPTYSVTYEYDETAPEKAPAVPVDEEKYYAGAEAKVKLKPSMVGYTFTGWTPKTEGVTITENTFTMPAQNVVLVGAWAKQPSYQITVEYYTITDGVMPDTCDETFTSEVFYRKDTADVGTYTYSATAPESRIGYTDDAELSEAGSGATLNATAQQLTGIVPAEDTAQVLVKLYRKVNKAYTATVRYHDANGNSLSSDVTSAPIVFGQTYDLTDLALSVIEVETAEGKKLYRFDHDDCTYKGTPYKGIMPANSFTITRVYVEMDTAVAVVRYVDENGQPLREDLMSAPVYIGEPYNVSEAKALDVIVQGNKEYQFKYHYQQRELVRSMGGLMAMNGDEYAGPMPVGGVIITRVYELSNETYYYQQKYVFTAYDANGDVVYSASEEWPVASTDQETVTITAPETYSHEGYGFNRKSEETQSAGLAGTTAERPHVFVVEYEMHEGDEPVPDTQLPPGLTPPQEPPKATDAPVADLPPQTGDDGVALYLVLMLCAAAGLAALIADHRKRCH